MRKTWMAAALVLGVVGWSGAEAQIPDAPKPQTIPLGPVTPGVGSPAVTSTSAGAPNADTGEPAVPTSLPSAPASAPGTAKADDDPGPPPDATLLPTISVNVNFVDIPFTVKDSKGHLVPGITWRDVRVYENGLRQQPKVFTTDPLPMSVAVVIDQSMGFQEMKRVNEALGALNGAFTPYDEVAVFTYNNGPQLRSGFTAGGSPLLEASLQRLQSAGRDQYYYAPGEGLGAGINLNNGQNIDVSPLGAGRGVGSPQGIAQVPREVHTLNDAIMLAARSLRDMPPDRLRVIYVISSGNESGSTAKTRDVIKYLQENNITVDATLTGETNVKGFAFVDRLHLPLTMRDNLLPVYTAATGGQYFGAYGTEAIENSFAKITEQARAQYTFGYYSKENLIDGKFRKLEVLVLRPGLQVIAKDGYYPTPTAQGGARRAGTPASAAPPSQP